MKISNAPFLASLNETLEDIATFEWSENGNVLSLDQGEKSRKETAWATWLISRDHDLAEYTILYYDNRQVTRVYNMTFEENAWTIWRGTPGFSQRFKATISQDKNRIVGKWEKSSDGKNWSHDFDISYTRVGN